MHKVDNKQIVTMKRELEAAILDAQALQNVLDEMATFEYSGKVFNKRYETQMNKFLAEKFGTFKSQIWDGGEKDVNLVNVYMHESFSYGYGEKRYELSVNYRGAKYDGYNGKIIEVTLNEKFFSVVSPENAREQFVARSEGLSNSIEKLRGNKRSITQLVDSYNKLADKIEAHNSKLSHVLSNRIRILE